MRRLVRDLELVLTMDPEVGEGPLGELRDAALLVEDGRVAWVGARADAPDADEVESLPGVALLPALVDCHTHAVWAGSRADDFLRRLRGESYTEILEAGGGILSTVRATRAADEDTLAALAAERLKGLAARGVGAVEIKSGYGLAPDQERKLLRAARRAGELAGVRVVRTFLGAHAVPAEHRGDRAAYVRQILEEQLPLVAAECDAIDAYVDRGAFTVDEGHTILSAGRDLGLAVRVHAEQVAYTGAAAMAAGLGARSADHLERVDAAGIAAMAAAGTSAVLLPGAMLYLRDPSPPVAAMREAGVRFAVGSDLNPGSSPVHDLWACATLACLTMGLTVEEALRGVTVEAARVLDLPDRGRLAPGCVADLVAVKPPVGEAPSPGALLQHLGGTTPRRIRADA